MLLCFRKAEPSLLDPCRADRGEVCVQLEHVHLLLCFGNNGFVDLGSDLLGLEARPSRPHVPARSPASTSVSRNEALLAEFLKSDFRNPENQESR